MDSPSFEVHLGFELSYLMKLRGLEYLTPTLLGTGMAAEQAVQSHFWAVVGAVEVVVVVKIVAKPGLRLPAA